MPEEGGTASHTDRSETKRAFLHFTRPLRSLAQVVQHFSGFRHQQYPSASRFARSLGSIVDSTSGPLTPGNRYLLPPENPTTSWGKTGPSSPNRNPFSITIAI